MVEIDAPTSRLNTLGMITTWQGLRVADGGRRQALTWAELRVFLSPSPPPPFLGEGSARDIPVTSPAFDPGHPGWSPCVFEGDRRRKEAIVAIHYLALETDSGTVSIQLATGILLGRGLRALVITTKSHTPTAPRLRYVIALSRPVSVEERERLYLFALTLGLDLAPAESRDPARFWFTTCAGTHPESGQALEVEGAPLDVDAVLARYPAPTHPVPVPDELPSPSPVTGGVPSNAPVYALKALDRACQAIASSPAGGHHDVITREAFAIGGLVGGGHIGQGDATRALLSAVGRAWKAETRAEAERTIRGQLREGMKKPRQIADRPRPAAPATSSTTTWSSSAVPQAATAPEKPIPVEAPHPEGSHVKGRIMRVVPADASPLAEAIAGIKIALLRARSGAPRKIVANATTIFALDPRWSDVLAYQALSDRVVKLLPPRWHTHDAPAVADPGPWTDADTTRAQAWLSREYGLDLGGEAVNAAIQASAERRVIDPLRDYFDALRGQWDGRPRCDLWLSAIFNAPDTPYARAVGSRWLISCVARALRPGCQVDHVLVLEGLQGKGKSTALRRMCPSDDLFFDSELALGDKDAIQVLRGKWIIELGELGALNRHEIQVVKAFVTRRIDTYRPSFGRRPIDAPRRFAFSGSTNEEEYLRDPTGNRRWWPVKVHGPVDLAAIDAHRDQIWAEALTRFEAGEVWYLETPQLVALARGEQELREEVDGWEERVGTHLAKALHDAPASAHHTPSCQCVRCAGVTCGGVLAGALGIEWGKQSKAEQARVAAILRGMGWTKGAQRRTDAGRVRPYFPSGAPFDA